jgi:hypothetical protein
LSQLWIQPCQQPFTKPTGELLPAGWVAKASFRDGRYAACAPEPVGNHLTLIAKIRADIGMTGIALVGFDFSHWTSHGIGGFGGLGPFQLLCLAHSTPADIHTMRSLHVELVNELGQSF